LWQGSITGVDGAARSERAGQERRE